MLYSTLPYSTFYIYILCVLPLLLNLSTWLICINAGALACTVRQHLKWIKKVHQSCPKTRTGIVQNSCITLMKGFDPLQMLTTVVVKGILHVFLEIGSFYNSPELNSWVLLFSNPFRRFSDI